MQKLKSPGFGLLGEHLLHSFSPLIHSELGNYEYRLYEKKPDELEAFLLHGKFHGLNVTIPYKKEVIPFCKSLSDTARITGSVNTITRQPDGSLSGDNTDYFGFSFLVQKTGVNITKGKALVLGSGGSSLTVQAVLRDMGAGEVVVVSRSGPINYGNIDKHSDAVLIVNTTPLGMYPDNGSSPLPDLGIFKQCKGIIDLIYNPAKTELLLQAEERGIVTVNGLSMLVAQAKKAAELFTGSSISNDVIEAISKKISQKTINIVLVGMPGCGKTSIGTVLSGLTGREFADSDAFITKAASKTIPDIITEHGEKYFRRLETEMLAKLCKQSGLVIATGGGVVTQQVNRHIICQNSIVFFLDRDLNQLPISGRPLSQRDGIKALADVRLPLYSKWSDHTVRVGDINNTAVDIYKKILD